MMRKNNIKKTLLTFLAIFSLLILILLLYGHKYDEIVGDKHLGFSLKFLFGTDYLGRDFFIRSCFATLNTILISLFSIICSIFIGVLLGMYAGYKNNKTLLFFKAIMNILEGIPDFLIAMILVFILNTLLVSGGFVGIFLTLVLISWTYIARIVINETVNIMKTNYVQYAILKGASFKHIMKFHLIPNLKEIILITVVQRIPNAIFLESFLSFVGIGIQPPYPSLGRMISEGVKFFRRYPREFIIPCIILIVVVFFFNYLGEILIENKRRNIK